MSFFKKYYPMVVSVLFMFIYGFLIGVAFNEWSFSNSGLLSWFILAVTIILVGGIWAEIIGFIVHAAKNKELKNSVAWGFFIYFFNVFIIPYYNLKYVVKEKKVTGTMIVFGVLMALSLVFGVVTTEIIVGDMEEQVLYVISEDGEVQFEFYGNYVEREVGEYELYASDYRKGVNVGAFVYTEEDELTVDDIQSHRDTWINSSRENVKVIDSYNNELDGRKISSKSYYGEKDGEAFVYQISTIEFNETGYIVNVIQVVFDEDYDKRKEEFKVMLENVKELEG